MKTCRRIVTIIMLGLIPCKYSFSTSEESWLLRQLAEKPATIRGVFIKPVYSSSTNTTVYFPSYEKNLTTGEINKYYSLGSVTLQRNTKGGVEKLYYLFPDHLSSTKMVVDKDKTQTSYLSYHPYGTTKTFTNPNSALQNLYTGQKKDQEINLYYYHARYYNPTTAHFLSADKAEGANRYAYVGNNPIMRNDPSGFAADSGGAWGGNSNSLPMVIKSGNYNSPDEIISSISDPVQRDKALSDFFRNHPNYSIDNDPAFANDPEKKDIAGFILLPYKFEQMAQSQQGADWSKVPGYMGIAMVGGLRVGGLDTSMSRPSITAQDIMSTVRHIFRESTALQAIREAQMSGDINEMTDVLRRLPSAIQRKYGTSFRTATTEEIRAGLVDRSNFGSIIERKNTIIFHPDYYGLNPERQLLEFGHEVGAMYIMRGFGVSKSNIPWVIEGSYAGTHYLDDILSGRVNPWR